MNGWFILSLVFIAPTIISLIVMLCTVDIDRRLISYKAVFAAIISFSCIVLCIVLGHLFPNALSESKRSGTTISYNRDDLTNAVKEVLEELPIEEKYELLSKFKER